MNDAIAWIIIIWLYLNGLYIAYTLFASFNLGISTRKLIIIALIWYVTLPLVIVHGLSKCHRNSKSDAEKH